MTETPPSRAPTPREILELVATRMAEIDGNKKYKPEIQRVAFGVKCLAAVMSELLDRIRAVEERLGISR